MFDRIINKDKLKSSLVVATGNLMSVPKSYDESLGELFADVQSSNVYDDNKIFMDMSPVGNVKQISEEYRVLKDDPHFDLREFINRHFYKNADNIINPVPYSPDILKHINDLWDNLERRNRTNKVSLIALPYKYIVPGGRFEEQFYWDSYFIMLGLAADNRWELIEGMLGNFVYMINKFGFIPTANRTYLLSRSQPPFFSHMVKLVAEEKGSHVLLENLPSMLKEYNFWIKGRSKLAKQEHKAYARLVEMNDGEHLNRYYDNKTTPRPESLAADMSVSSRAVDRDPDRIYLHLRAGAESGWDFSSRWFAYPNSIDTIHTSDIVPVDLNCLLYHLELTISETYKVIKQPLLSGKFQKMALKRADAINKYCWDENDKFFVDYNFHHKKPTGQLSLAGVFPLYVGMATQEQASAVASKLDELFLKKGGLLTTLTNNHQQWDAPNGWAPLHWIAISGLRRYGYDELADRIQNAWISTNRKVFETEHRLIEKYNVLNHDGIGVGGEYPLQDGFGWTNGVLVALIKGVKET